jgi:crossover junction endodeoxyribonuclease RuvC
MGVDPGVSGAIAFYDCERHEAIAVYDMPAVGKEVDGASIADMITRHSPSIAIIESVHAMPKQGVSSSFNFGFSYGSVRGVVAGAKVRTVLVAPTKWKKHYGLSSDKEMSRALAIRTWPGASDFFRRKKDDGRAEAALLAYYGASLY